MNNLAIDLKNTSPIATLSETSIFFVMDEKCNVLSMSERARDKCGLTGDEINKRLWCDSVIDGFPLYDCPPKSFGISNGYLKTVKGKIAGVFIYYPIKDEGGKITGSIWNFIRQESEFCCDVSSETFWATKNKTMAATIQMALVAAKKDIPISIFGETGTGKTELAKFIRQHSAVREGPFIHINCSAIPETLFESELFGYEKGAFTGANTEKRGYIALADGGTLFLDEISDMPIGCQSKLLTFLDSMKYRPLGAVKERTSKVRIISSSNQPLWEMVKTGNFREDLFFRISVVRLFIPPLRERKEDIPGIINNFLNHKKHIGAQAMKLLLSHIWPGNIRELFSTLESACICSAENETLQPEHIGLDYDKTHVYTESKKPKDEKLEIMQALKKSSNHKSLAAQFLGMSRITLWRRIKKYGIGVDENSCDETCSCHRL